MIISCTFAEFFKNYLNDFNRNQGLGVFKSKNLYSKVSLLRKSVFKY